jgi:hypothetical protein
MCAFSCFSMGVSQMRGGMKLLFDHNLAAKSVKALAEARNCYIDMRPKTGNLFKKAHFGALLSYNHIRSKRET